MKQDDDKATASLKPERGKIDADKTPVLFFVVCHSFIIYTVYVTAKL